LIENGQSFVQARRVRYVGVLTDFCKLVTYIYIEIKYKYTI